MNRYDPALETFADIQFTRQDPCIWVVYPPGAAGDLVASLIHLHYFRTGAKFFGINDRGQVIFRPSDNKQTNRLFPPRIDVLAADKISYYINETFSEDNINYSRVDQVILSNHYWKNDDILSILENFTSSKIIRILPSCEFERKICQWFADYKNNSLCNPFEDIKLQSSFGVDRFVDNSRVFEIPFGKIFQPMNYEKIYDQLINFLDLPCKLIRFDFIQYWISMQHEIIQSQLNEIALNEE